MASKIMLMATLMLLIDATLPEICQDDQVSVRLVNGTSERNGRVELCWNSWWKAVCDSGWGRAEANTVCRELGYLNSNDAVAVTGSHFGDAQEIHNINQWNCRPTETILAHCDKIMTQEVCSPSETAGVYCQGEDGCQDGDIRLMNGSLPSSYEGRVEICFSGVWGTICSDGWDSREATVVCRQLGILDHAILGLSSSDFYDEGGGPIFLDRIDCHKNDTRLADCARHDLTPGMVGDGCTHSKDAGVICKGGSNCSDGEIRLVGGQSQNEGVVEICFSGVWGTICDDGWDSSDARVACRQLGYIQGATLKIVNVDDTNAMYHLSHVRCKGQESRLVDCSHEGVGVHTCELNSYENAAVVCSGSYTLVILTQATPFRSSSSVASLSLNSSTATIRSTPIEASTPMYPGSLSSTRKVILGCLCGVLFLIILVLVLVALVIFKRKQKSPFELKQRRDTCQQQHDGNVTTTKGVSTTSPNHHSDQEMEHNFNNPIYTMVDRGCQTVTDVYSSFHYEDTTSPQHTTIDQQEVYHSE